MKPVYLEETPEAWVFRMVAGIEPPTQKLMSKIIQLKKGQKATKGHLTHKFISHSRPVALHAQQ